MTLENIIALAIAIVLLLILFSILKSFITAAVIAVVAYLVFQLCFIPNSWERERFNELVHPAQTEETISQIKFKDVEMLLASHPNNTQPADKEWLINHIADQLKNTDPQTVTDTLNRLSSDLAKAHITPEEIKQKLDH